MTKVTLIYALFFPFLVGGQSLNQIDSAGRKQGQWVTEVSLGDYLEILYVNGIPEGKFRKIDSFTKRVIVEGTYKNGLLDGVYRKFYSNGNLSEIVTYQNGMRQGFLFWYHDNGKISGKMFFRNDILDGYVEGYNEDGKLLSKNMWKNGIQSDSFYRYDKHERLICIEVQYSRKKYGEFSIIPIMVDEHGVPVCSVNLRECLPPKFKGAEVDHLYKKGIFRRGKKLAGWKFEIKHGKRKEVYKFRLDRKGHIKNNKCPCTQVSGDKP